jgi:hypothetical protein
VEVGEHEKERIFLCIFFAHKKKFLENYFIVDGMFLNRYLYSSTLAKISTWSHQRISM